MTKLFTFKLSRIFILTGMVCMLSASRLIAQEDSCVAGIAWEQDAIDPMVFNFSWNGTVPPGSFSYSCIWNFGDGNTSADSITSHTYMQPGSYTVCIDFTICIGGGLSCHDDTCITVTAGALSGIEAANGLSGFCLFPNPVTSDLNLLMNPGAGTVSVSVLTPAGKEIMSKLVSTDSWKMDVSGLPTGFYLVRASANGKSFTRKLVVDSD